MKYDSDIDLLVDFPAETLGDAWNFAETACWDHGLDPDLMPYSWCKPAFLDHIAHRPTCGGISDARWFEIDAAVAATVRHFMGASKIFAQVPGAEAPEDRYLVEMGFMGAMLAGQTFLEAALVRILDLNGEEAPTGARWHADLIQRAAHPVGDRPAILGPAAARAADQTRRFRSISAHAYDAFDHTQAVAAVRSAALLGAILPSEIARFRQATDP